LTDELVSNFPNRDGITLNKELDDFSLDARKLQSVGIIINELLTNTMKYAFKGRDEGRIAISSKRGESSATIVVEDDGVGMPPSVDFERSTGFGLRLVQALSQQLDGSIRIERDKGTRFVLEFPV
jgi:two-component sensor histidine kinase